MQITEHIHALKIPFQITVTPGTAIDRFVYAYLICGENITLVDTGVSGSGKIIFDYLKSIGRGPGEISTIFLTHSHPDHIGSARSIKEISGCSVIAHSAERFWIEDVGLQLKERPVPGFNTLVEGSVAVDRVVENGEVVKLDGTLALEIFHTPGHSKGSVSLYLKNDNALFCGDAILLPGQMPIFEDLPNCINSVNMLKRIRGVEALLSSWDAPQKGKHVYELMDESIKYLMKIHEAIRTTSSERSFLEPMEFCKAVLDKLGLPEAMVNPLVLRSFQSGLNSFGKNTANG